MRFVLLVQPSNEEATLQSICLIRDLLVCLSGFATPEEAFGLSLLLLTEACRPDHHTWPWLVGAYLEFHRLHWGHFDMLHRASLRKDQLSASMYTKSAEEVQEIRMTLLFVASSVLAPSSKARSY